MRIAIVDIIGYLIRDLVNSTDLGNDDQSVQKQVDVFFDILNERTRDLSSYVRTKVLAVLTKLCDLPAKFPKQRLDMSKLAVGMLEDKVATVRKNALTLLSQLVITHPYGLMHGGLMVRKDWEEHYDKVSEELRKMEDIVGKAVENAEEAAEAEKSAADDGKGEEKDKDDDENENEEGESQTPKKKHKSKPKKK
jgi:condensin complex subunit 1